ncbi:hypothetical protein H2201_007368 [Coniosporium apollinis]|uniref:Acetoacetate-CoA ligase n=1 Tax=Coniosporium apollinis TaxID=61459 RepID=A0ABQ9NJK4_9PEZI|nr:hypothetical protein H2201_007368 [Coniosporium apollinis]
MAASSQDTMPIPRKLWEHPSPKSTQMCQFMQTANQRHDLNLQTFQDLHQWSVTQPVPFWADVWTTASLIHSGTYATVVDPTARIDSLPKWFKGVRLNFAENILFSRSEADAGQRTTCGKEDAKVAVTQVREGGSEVQDVTYGELRRRVGRLAQALKARGVRKGDRVAVVASNSVDTLAVFLATTALGGLFSSSSTDMGTKGVLDRLLQIRPKWVFVDDWAVYNGKTVDLRGKMGEIVEGLGGVEEFEGCVAQPRFREPADVSGVPKAMTLWTFLEAAAGRTELEFERVEFSDPFLVVYSSGTTGQPKCIVHSTGGVLISSMKEGKLHRDLGPDTVQLQYTTTGWIMYMSAVLALLYGGRSVLYDGSPFQPDLKSFIRLVGDQKVTNLGISPRYLHELQKHSIIPRQTTDLSALRAVTSTGMVLPDALFAWFYDTAFPPSVQLANISGGTDIAGCFGMENPLQPLYVGGCMGPSLGIKVEVYDSTIEGGKGVQGRAVEDGVPGELVATKPFPNVPVFFWGDESGEKYFNAYYARFDNVWTHGDFVVRHPSTGQLIFLGRADGVLNPSGVRFGSAEIYNVVERYFPQVADSICVGRRRPQDADEAVMLFLLMAEGERFTEELVREVKSRIGKELSPRHVPRFVFETKEIPTTVNLKKVELPVKQIVSGRIIKPSGTLLNPQSLQYYYQFAKVEEPVKSKL